MRAAHDTPRKFVQPRPLARLDGRKSLDSLAFAPHPDGVKVRVHDSLDEFRAIAEPLYRRDRVGHTIELTLLNADRFPAGSLLTTMWDDGTAVGAALQTPPHPLMCNGIPHGALSAVADDLVARRPGLTGVRGMRDSAEGFADAWRRATGRTAVVDTEERLYRLGTLRSPNGVPGTARRATADDRGQLAEWVGLFFQETFSQRDEAEPGRFVDNAGRVGDRFVVWEVGGTPVSMAMLRAAAADVSRIGPVFTPLPERGHGYGSAVTAAAAVLAHRSGTPDVVLFADLANPTSNAIYQQIGFEPVADSVRIAFAAA